ncbi:MAG: Opr family porin [Wolinella sp.]
MKKNLLLFIACAGIALANSYTLEEAFKNGSFKGDIGVYFENRHVIEGWKTQYYNNTSWAVSSIALDYQTDLLYNFRFATGFRGSAPVYEDDPDFITAHGKGDASERIYAKDRVLLSKLYVEYSTGGGSALRVGRQPINTDWMTKINDAVRFTSTSIPGVKLDLIWSRARGRAYLKEMFGFQRTNPRQNHSGVANMGITFKVGELLSVKGYGIYAESVMLGGGGKAVIEVPVNNELTTGIVAHYALSDEKHSRHFGSVAEGKIYLKFLNTKLTFAHVRTGRKVGRGSLGIAGDLITPFEEGDVMNERDARTTYGALSTSIEKLSLSGAFGTTEYKRKYSPSEDDDKEYRQNELSIWLNYAFTKHFKALLTYDRTFKAQPGFPALVQVSTGMSYSF